MLQGCTNELSNKEHDYDDDDDLKYTSFHRKDDLAAI